LGCSCARSTRNSAATAQRDQRGRLAMFRRSCQDTGFLFMTAGVTGYSAARPDQPHLAVRTLRARQDLLRRQPDWYMAGSTAALRIMPSWRRRSGATRSWEIFLPRSCSRAHLRRLLHVAGLERKFTGTTSCTTLGRPRDRPKRTALGRPCSPSCSRCSPPVRRRARQLLPHLAHEVLWFFRIAIFVVRSSPPRHVAYLHRDAASSGIGKRKRAVIVSRSETGEYTTTPAPGRWTRRRRARRRAGPVLIDMDSAPEPEPVDGCGREGAGAGVRRHR